MTFHYTLAALGSSFSFGCAKMEMEKKQLCGHVASTIKELQRESSTLGENEPLRKGPNVQRLCGAIELILRHGLASSWRNGFTSSPSFFPVASRISRKDVVQDIKALSHCTTDHARARAWIRLAVNEQSLESYVSSLAQDQDVLNMFYDISAVVRDPEMITELLGLLAGMSFTMNFDLPLDDPSLGYEPTPIANYVAAEDSYDTPAAISPDLGVRMVPADIPVEAPEELKVEPRKKPKKKKKKRKTVANIEKNPAAEYTIEGDGQNAAEPISSSQVLEQTIDHAETDSQVPEVARPEFEITSSDPSVTHDTLASKLEDDVILSTANERVQAVDNELQSHSNVSPLPVSADSNPREPNVEIIQEPNNDITLGVASIPQNVEETYVVTESLVSQSSLVSNDVENGNLEPNLSTETQKRSLSATFDGTDLTRADGEDNQDNKESNKNEKERGSSTHKREKKGHVRSMSDGFNIDSAPDSLTSLQAKREKLGLQPFVTDSNLVQNENPLESVVPIVEEDESEVIPTFDFSRMEEMLKLLDVDTFDDRTSVRTATPTSDLAGSLPRDRYLSEPVNITTEATKTSIKSRPQPLAMPSPKPSPKASPRPSHVGFSKSGESNLFPPLSAPTELSDTSSFTESPIVDPQPITSNTLLSDTNVPEVDFYSGEAVGQMDIEKALNRSSNTILKEVDLWDVGSLSIPECEEIIYENADGDFLVCLDMNRTVKESVDEFRWLYVNDSGKIARFAIKKINRNYEFEGVRYDSVRLIIRRIQEGSIRLRSPSSGLDLVLRSPVQDSQEWLRTTMFSNQNKSPNEDILDSNGDGAVNAWVEAARNSPAITPISSRSSTPTSAKDRKDGEYVVIDDKPPSLTSTPFKSMLKKEDDNIDELLREINIRVNIVRKAAQQHNPESSQNQNTQKAINELVDLRYRYQQAKEQLNADKDFVPAEQFGGAIIKSNGHMFQIHPAYPNPELCDHCNLPIKTKLMHNPLKPVKPRAYRCLLCKYTIHRKCLPNSDRECRANQVVTSGLQTHICPEGGLSAQGYKCSDCSCEIGFQGFFAKARVCDYTGLYYCPECHKEEQMVIPARVIQNWDFSPRSVSQGSKETLSILHERPIIDLQACNPLLNNHVEEIKEFSRLRHSMKLMTKFLFQCRFAAKEPKLLSRLEDRPYLYKTENIYSLRDLLELKDGTLLPIAEAAQDAWERHIRKECLLCSAKGSYCELCNSKQVIFPFDVGVSQCSKCKAALHTSCLQGRVSDGCPRCDRIAEYSRRNTGPSIQAAAEDSDDDTSEHGNENES